MILVYVVWIWLFYGNITHTDDLATLLLTLLIFISGFVVTEKNTKIEINKFFSSMLILFIMLYGILLYEYWKLDTIIYQDILGFFDSEHDNKHAVLAFILYIAGAAFVAIVSYLNSLKVSVKKILKLYFNNIYLEKCDDLNSSNTISIACLLKSFNSKVKSYNIPVTLMISKETPKVTYVATLDKATDKWRSIRIVGYKIFIFKANEKSSYALTDVLEQDNTDTFLKAIQEENKKLDEQVELNTVINFDKDNYVIYTTSLVANSGITVFLKDDNKITIKKGELEGEIKISVNESQYNFFRNYADKYSKENQYIKFNYDTDLNFDNNTTKDLEIKACIIATENIEIPIDDKNHKIIIKKGESKESKDSDNKIQLKENYLEKIQRKINEENKKLDGDIELNVKINLCDDDAKCIISVVASKDITIPIENKKIIIKKGEFEEEIKIPVDKCQYDSFKDYATNYSEEKEYIKFSYDSDLNFDNNTTKYLTIKAYIVTTKEINIPIDDKNSIVIKQKLSSNSTNKIEENFLKDLRAKVKKKSEEICENIDLCTSIYLDDTNIIYTTSMRTNEDIEISLSRENKIIIKKYTSLNTITIPEIKSDIYDEIKETTNGYDNPNIKFDYDTNLKFNDDENKHKNLIITVSIVATNNIEIPIDDECNNITIDKGKSIGEKKTGQEKNIVNRLIKRMQDDNQNKIKTLSIKINENMNYDITCNNPATYMQIPIYDNHVITTNGIDTSNKTSIKINKQNLFFKTIDKISTTLENPSSLEIKFDPQKQSQKLTINTSKVVNKDIKIPIDVSNIIEIKKGSTKSEPVEDYSLLKSITPPTDTMALPKDNDPIVLKYNNSDWKEMIHKFSNEHRKESLKLAKKNHLMEEYKIDYSAITMTNIFDIRHKISILNSFQETAMNINMIKESNPVPKLIFISKIIYYYMLIFIALKSLGSITNYFKNVLLAIFAMSFIFIICGIVFDNNNPSFIELVNHYDLFIFIVGVYIFTIATPLSYLFYTSLKLNSVDINHDSKHDGWSVFAKNIGYYSFTFFVTISLITTSVTFLASSGLEYNKAFHFISNLILPTLRLQDIPEFFTEVFGSDVVFGIFIVKIFFLLFIFSLVVLFIQHMIERYTELADNAQSDRYNIPPEFAKFFSYLLLSILAIVLLYGTLFINYPNLSTEYNVCKNYLDDNYKTRQNCVNAMSKNYITANNNLNTTEGKIANKFATTKDNNQSSVSKLKKYCGSLPTLNESDIGLCAVAMSIERDDVTSRSNTMISSPTRSLSDYLPLSIFLALFGTVIMLATKNLLENYFSGLSLKFNVPYEEGERVTINGGEMLVVETISFRATTFYGIKTNTHQVIPNHTLTNSVIANYTKPTLDYREEITIFIPDQKHINKNIPRIAEKVLLLAAFITTGVKKPRLPIGHDFEIISNTEKDITKLKELENSKELLINENWKKLTALDKKHKRKLFLYGIISLIEKDTSLDKNEIKIIKKIVTSIISVLNDYNKNKEFHYHLDEYLVKRKFEAFKDYEHGENEDPDEKLKEIGDYLVSISYYYFALTKQLWSLKLDDKSKQKQNDFDQASLDVLDVPRVTSKHRRDYEGAFWEVTLLVTVELGEQSDEIVQHINMFADTLWDIFDLPSRCRKDDENSPPI